MINKKIAFMAIPALAAVLILGTFAPAFAGSVATYCSTDKNNPTIGNHGGTIVIANLGDDCYIGKYGTSTSVNIIDLDGAGKVVIVNTFVGEAAIIENTSEKIKFKNSHIDDDQLIIRNNDVSHLEMMDNTGSFPLPADIESNQADILKIVGNSGYDISMKNNLIDSFAICKNNTPEPHSWAENTYNGKNKGCP